MSEQGNAVEALGPVVADYYMVHVKSLVGTKLGPFYASGPSQAIDLANKFLEENYPLFGTMLRGKGDSRWITAPMSARNRSVTSSTSSMRRAIMSRTQVPSRPRRWPAAST